MRSVATLVLLCAVVTAAAQTAADGPRAEEILRLWGGESPPRGVVTAVDIDGVTIVASGITRVISWDRVQSVGEPFEAEGEQYKDIAHALWRARTRLQRGDVVGAEPLFEQLAIDYQEREGATAALVFEGLLRCQLRRGAQASAIAPWIRLLQTSHAMPDDPTGGFMRPVIDPATRLVPSLPPIWSDSPSVRALAQSGLSVDDPKTSALAMLYLHAASFEIGIADGAPDLSTFDPNLRNDPAIGLVADIVIARSGDAEERREARHRLSTRIELARSPWIEAWCRAGLGRSLLREDDPELVRRGVLQLLHAPIRLEAAVPYLAGLALADAAAALEDLGDDESAAVLRRHLIDRFQGHPSIDHAGAGDSVSTRIPASR